MATKVHFWEASRGKAKYKTYICFGNLSNPLPSRVIYLIPIDKNLSKDETLFYLNFLDNILDKSIYRYKIIEKSKKFPNHLMLTVQTKGMIFKHALLYFTAFRYLDEYPEIVNQLFQFKNIEDYSDLFVKFLKIHFDYKKIKKVKQGNLEGHGLITYYFDSDFTCISLDEFKYNLSSNLRFTSVHNFFKTTGTFKQELGDKYKSIKISPTNANFAIDK